MLSCFVSCTPFLAPSDFHVCAHANVCVSLYPSVCLCVCGGGGGGGGVLHICACVCASGNGESELSTGLGSTSLTCQVPTK